MENENKLPFVSALLVTRNEKDYIRISLMSLIEQTYPKDKYEIIVIDGGSTDGTLDIIKKYDKSIACWISEPDGGIYEAMNKGIKRATGDIIGFINSDDILKNNTKDLAYKETYEVLKNKKIKLLVAEQDEESELIEV